MSDTPQIDLPFSCLDFSGRASVAVWEIAKKVGVSPQHILDHVDEGTLVAIDTKLISSRRNLRVPVEEYRRWVIARLTGPARTDFIASLPAETLREIAREIAERLSVLAA